MRRVFCILNTKEFQTQKGGLVHRSSRNFRPRNVVVYTDFIAFQSQGNSLMQYALLLFGKPATLNRVVVSNRSSGLLAV